MKETPRKQKRTPNPFLIITLKLTNTHKIIANDNKVEFDQKTKHFICKDIMVTSKYSKGAVGISSKNCRNLDIVLFHLNQNP